MISEANLRQAIRLTQEKFRAGVGQAGILDVAFIGNTSDVYPWEPASIVDIDLCLFVDQMDTSLGEWLLATGNEIGTDLGRLGIDFDLKVLRGPYKPGSWRLTRPMAIAHVAIFTEASYARASPALRWAWRKYRCLVEPDRLMAYCGEAPSWLDLREMVERKLTRIKTERIQMTEWKLPTFRKVVLEFDTRHPVFAEYCLASPLICARIHARILGKEEADRLPNREFVIWYRREMLDVVALEDLLLQKDRARQHGYEGLLPTVKDLAVRYFEEFLQSVHEHH